MKYQTVMEEDRAETDLGIAADIEEAQRLENQADPSISSPLPSASTPVPSQTPQASAPTQLTENAVKQPKKRFVGRRAAAEGAGARNGQTTAPGDGGESRAIQG